MHTLLLSIICLFSNQNVINKPKNDVSLKFEINKSIIEGFFENDSTNVGKNTYFVK